MLPDLRVISLLLAMIGMVSSEVQHIDITPIIPEINKVAAVHSMSADLRNYHPIPSFAPRSAQDIAIEFAQRQFKLTRNDYIITDSYLSKTSGITHVYLQQTIKGVKIANSRMSVHVDRANRVMAYDNSFFNSTAVKEMTTTEQASSTNKLVTRQINDWNGRTNGFASPVKALSTFASHIKQPFDADKVQVVPLQGDTKSTGQSYLIKNVDFTEHGNVTVSQSYLQLDEHSLVPTWQFYVPMPLNHFSIHVSADGNKLLYLHDLVNFASYRVVKLGDNNPVDTPREYEATGTNWENGYRPNGGNDLKFDYPFDTKKAPKSNVDASITNLFYLVNTAHDLFYKYGFDEVAGNFQEDNGTKGGKGGDAVIAHALYGYNKSSAYRNNAFFKSTEDGKRPMLAMYAFDGQKPERDGAMENGVVLHEYGHGVSNRLTGGPSNVDCLSDGYAAGMNEGWSDFYAYWMEMKATDKPTKQVEFGHYSAGSSFRIHPYSTDLTANPLKVDKLNDKNWTRDKYSVGTLWATILYEVYWSLVNKLGFQENLFSADLSKGNTLLLQLVLDGLKMQPCNPTFITARNAIIEAEHVITGGKHACELWRGFAKRGLGYDAIDKQQQLVPGYGLPTNCKA
ncbi:Fungalysin metallopeptidase-domain-containing protein [Syncephalis plumigaleata]|nr:Fungalysin metallopeptidase-domain-containing protein [Syncephalis plumigaleata]